MLKQGRLSAMARGLRKRRGFLAFICFQLTMGCVHQTVADEKAQPQRSSNVSKSVQRLTIILPGDVPLEMVRIPAGTFRMGARSAAGEDAGTVVKRELPLHQVTIRAAFYLAAYELTQKQWVAVTGHNPSSHPGNLNCPVENVSWNGCQTFIRAINKLEQGVFRLPSEAEWEYACRGGSQTRWSFGDDPKQLTDHAWCADNWGTQPQAHPVGGKLPNPFGLYDMHGNMWEWVEDWYHPNYVGLPTDGSANTAENPKYPYKVLRGGAWFLDASFCRAAYRNVQFCRVDYPDHFNCTYHHGVRLARDP